MDRQEFAARTQALRQRLYRTAYLYLGREADALEAVDEAVYQALRSLGQLRQEAYFETWLTRILLNECHRELRRRKRLAGEEALPETLPGRRYALLDGVQDPGNVGTILRTADALFCDGLLLVGGCADPWQPKAVRASMGAVLRCPVWSCTAEEAKGLLSRSGIPLYGAALRRDTLDARAIPEGKAAIAIGSEGRGLSAEMLALCDATVRIPMAEHCESLNAAAAAAVLLWELARRDAPGK